MPAQDSHCDGNQQFSIIGVQGTLGTADTAGTAQTLPIGVNPSTGAMYTENLGVATSAKQDDIIAALTTPTGINGAPVTVGTTAVEMTFTGTTQSVCLLSDHDNTGKIWFGPSTVTSAGANAYGRLAAGQAVTFDLNDASAAIYAVSDTAGQKVYKTCLI